MQIVHNILGWLRLRDMSSQAYELRMGRGLWYGAAVRSPLVSRGQFLLLLVHDNHTERLVLTMLEVLQLYQR